VHDVHELAEAAYSTRISSTVIVNRLRPGASMPCALVPPNISR
jgi:hypothetical protein